jgi:hypothetical protein
MKHVVWNWHAPKGKGEVAQLLIGTEMCCEQPESSWKVHSVHTAAAAV